MFPRYRQCCTMFRKMKEECRYSIPSRRIKGRRIETGRKRYPTHIEVYIEIFAPCGFSATYCVRARARTHCWRSRLTVTLGVHQPTKPKQGNLEGGLVGFRKGTLSPPNFALERNFAFPRPSKSNLS